MDGLSIPNKMMPGWQARDVKQQIPRSLGTTLAWLGLIHNSGAVRSGFARPKALFLDS
jgi:hypothetical protein